jgi:hypothetical protein
MDQHLLSEIVAGRIWASERPVWFGGVRLRARTSVIRLDDGRLLVHSPAPLSDGLAKQMADLGKVSWLVVPNCFHHLGTPAAAAAFPLYHRPTETLFGADVVLKADETDHWSWRFAARITGCFKRVRVPPDVRKKVVDKEAASRSLRALQALQIRRLVVAHGAVIEDAPLAQLVEAWRLEGVA